MRGVGGEYSSSREQGNMGLLSIAAAYDLGRMTSIWVFQMAGRCGS